jgi:hypothetical protein
MGSNPCLPAIPFCKARRRRKLAVKRQHHNELCLSAHFLSLCPLTGFCHLFRVLCHSIVSPDVHVTQQPHPGTNALSRHVAELAGVHVATEARKEKPLATFGDQSRTSSHYFGSIIALDFSMYAIKCPRSIDGDCRGLTLVVKIFRLVA